MTSNFYEYIHAQLRTNPDTELIRWPDPPHPDQTYTGSDLLNRIAAIRNRLAARQVQPGQPVMLATPVTIDLICTILAIMAMGAIPVLPPAAASWPTLLRLVRRGDIRAMVTGRTLNPLVSWLVRRAGITPVSVTGISGLPAQWLPPHPVDPEQPALISHSSGSAGAAKSVRRSHRVLLAQHLALSEAFPAWPGQRDFPLFPNILLHNLALGTVSVLPDLPGFKLTEMDPARIVRQIVSQRVETLTGNVYYVRQLLHHLERHPQLFPDVRAVGIGGSPVPEFLIHSLRPFFARADLYIIYGSSEAEPIAVRKTDPAPLSPRFGYAVGTVHPSLQLQLRPIGTLTFDGVAAYPVGEICVKGPHVATGHNDWFQTGDYGYMDAANQLFLTGRQGNERLHRGIQHYQVEHVLAHVQGVERAAVLSTEQGFTMYIQGSVERSLIWQALVDSGINAPFVGLHARGKLPVDARHQSKIRYDQLT